ncbi:MAG: ribose-5-phosphate isomerase RpiA [Candidatus Promineifilaceae bacterium]|jgi:ribose 5-phosphate isomerase A
MDKSIDELKREAAVSAVNTLQSGMVVGLGSGSTAYYAVVDLGMRLADGSLNGIVGIPTSEATAQLARQHHIPLGTLDEHPHVDITIDGADEIDPQLNLIKGLGHSLLREKIVVTSTERFIVISDDRKLVDHLGMIAPVPVEVIQFAKRPVSDYLQTLGCRPVLRLQDGQPRITDEGNIILDCYFETIKDPFQLAAAIRKRPGVVEHGLFLRMAAEAYVASPTGVQHLTASVQ